MRLTDILTPERVIPDLKSTSREDVLRELVLRGFLEDGKTEGLDDDDEERVVRVLEEREQLGSTGIKDGLAIPHGKLAGFPRLTACLGLHKKGIDFGALDKVDSKVFIVLLSPESSGGEHLKALARISRLFSGGGLQRRLMEQEGRDAIFDELAAEDARL